MPKTAANLWIRLLADQIDAMLFFLPHSFFLTVLASSVTIPQLLSGFFLYLIAIFFPLLIFSFFYKSAMTYYFGGSLGKLLSGLRVTNLESKRLSFKKSFFRYTTGYAFSWVLFGLGFFTI